MSSTCFRVGHTRLPTRLLLPMHLKHTIPQLHIQSSSFLILMPVDIFNFDVKIKNLNINLETAFHWFIYVIMLQCTVQNT